MPIKQYMGSRANEDRTLLFAGGKNDGNVSARFTEDNMEVYGDFYPPQEGGNKLSVSELTAALARFNVVYGLLEENIKEAVDKCNESRYPLKDIPLARGDPPVREIREYYDLNPKLNSAPPEPKGNARVDYRSYSPFIIVKKGQVLAFKKARREGRNGTDVNGNVIPFGSVSPEGVTGGENTQTDEKYIYAAMNGQLIQEKNILRVQDSLAIKGAVDYHTGNIVFPGDITIEGPVSDGFKIYSGGSITIKQTFDVTDAIAKGDLCVSGGIIGRGRALVKAGGILRAKFIENCKAAVRKSVFVEADIVNSSIYTMEELEMGEKGVILGGEIYAVKGIKTGSIGKKSGKNTNIHCGVDFTALQEKEKLNYNLRIINAKLTKARELLAAGIAEYAEPEENSPAAQRLGKINEAIRHLEEEKEKTGAAITAILERLNPCEGAVVEAQGEIAAGTLIEICQVALFVTEPLRRIRIRLDRAHNRLITESLGK